MSADKRSVATDALATLGTILDDKQKRDAIHLAVEPVIAGDRLYPGEHVYVVDGVAFRAQGGNGLGIVDPFLSAIGAAKGERFWFVMYPRMVHSLRHVWTHPAFPDEPGTPSHGESAAVTAAKARIAEIADELDDSGSVEEGHEYGASVPMTYERLMAAAGRWEASQSEWGEYTTEHGADQWRDVFPSYAEEFWKLYCIVTGKDVPGDRRESFFSCTC